MLTALREVQSAMAATASNQAGGDTGGDGALSRLVSGVSLAVPYNDSTISVEHAHDAETLHRLTAVLARLQPIIVDLGATGMVSGTEVSELGAEVSQCLHASAALLTPADATHSARTDIRMAGADAETLYRLTAVLARLQPIIADLGASGMVSGTEVSELSTEVVHWHDTTVAVTAGATEPAAIAIAPVQHPGLLSIRGKSAGPIAFDSVMMGESEDHEVCTPTTARRLSEFSVGGGSRRVSLQEDTVMLDGPGVESPHVERPSVELKSRRQNQQSLTEV
jgi:hypothetical protein